MNNYNDKRVVEPLYQKNLKDDNNIYNNITAYIEHIQYIILTGTFF